MALTQDEQRAALVSWMPPGMAWVAFRITDTVAWKFLNGLAPEFVRLAQLIEDSRKTIPKTSNNTDFLLEWEFALGIPDDCLPATGSTEERWTHVLAKFASMNIQTNADWIALAAIFGFVITVSGGIGSSLYPVGFFADDKEARNYIVVTFDIVEPIAFPYTFPIQFEQNQTQIMECMFTKLKPVHNMITFLYV